MDLLIFILLSGALIIFPGPNVLVIISTSITHGTVLGLQTVAGTASAMAVQLLIAATGTSWLITSLAQGFIWLKWFGVMYLCYLGINQLICAIKPQQAVSVSALDSFGRGFMVSLTNPKTILFFGAFLPQFVQPSASYLPQIALLSTIFWLLAVASDSVYALFASMCSRLLNKQKFSRAQNIVTGALYLGAGAALAVTRQR